MQHGCKGSEGFILHVVHRWIKTDCGRAKYAELVARPGLLARLRLGWFVAIAALRDWPLPDKADQPGQGPSKP